MIIRAPVLVYRHWNLSSPGPTIWSRKHRECGIAIRIGVITTSVECSQITFRRVRVKTTGCECALLVVELVLHYVVIRVLNCVIIGRLLKLAELVRTLEHFTFRGRHFGDLVRLRILVHRGDYSSTVNPGLLRPRLNTYTTLHHIEDNNAAHNRSYQHHYNRLRFPLARSHLLNRPNFNYLWPLSCICIVFYIFYLFILHNSDNIYLACFADPIIGDRKIHF